MQIKKDDSPISIHKSSNVHETLNELSELNIMESTDQIIHNCHSHDEVKGVTDFHSDPINHFHMKNNKKGTAPDYFALSLITIMVAVVFISELTVGYLFHSLTLLSDAFHLLSDVTSLIIALIALKLSNIKSIDGKSRFSYGYSRAEIIGGLINGVFLLCAVVFILLEALESLFLKSNNVKQPWIILGIGIIGMLVNLFGIILFGGHSHISAHPDSNHHHHGKKENMNMKAVFIHLLSDFLGNIGVIISSLLVINIDSKLHPWISKVDPCCSILLALIIFFSSIPLVRRCIVILMQSTPECINMQQLMWKLMEIDTIVDIKNLHIWQLSSSEFVATIRIVCNDIEDFSVVLSQIKATFHEFGIDNTTIEPTFIVKYSKEL